MIPPRPWLRAHSQNGAFYGIADRNGDDVKLDGDAQDPERARIIADHVIRLVNAEPEIVAALEAAYQTLLVGHKSAEDTRRSFGMVRAALAKVRP